jgi:hypothetical protein
MLRINALNGLSWSFDVFQNGAQKRTFTSLVHAHAGRTQMAQHRWQNRCAFCLPVSQTLASRRRVCQRSAFFKVFGNLLMPRKFTTIIKCDGMAQMLEGLDRLLDGSC